ncbi:MAG: RNA polymerase sigma factor [Polaribacter sp.]
MNKTDFKITVFSLSERLFPMVARMLGDTFSTEDAIQDIMMKLWEKRTKIQNHQNIKGLVFLTARNHCIDILRKKQKRVSDSSNYLKNITSNNNDDIQWNELNKIINQILKDIPKQQKEVFILRDIDGCEFSEIATMLEIKITHVRVLLSRARKQIGETLENNYHYERGAY